MLASFPSPSSNSISIGPLELRAYGLMIALGVVAAIWVCGRMLEAKGRGTRDDAASIGMWGVGVGIVGARLYHVVTDFQRFEDNLAAIPKIWEGGLGIPGGLLFGVIGGLWEGKRRGIDSLVLLTCAAPAIPLAQAIGRWGNYFNQELFGKPTDLPWAVEIDIAHRPPAYVAFETFHPVFLYESLWCLVLAAALVWIDRRWSPRPGRLFPMYMIGYGVFRWWLETVRIDTVNKISGQRLNFWVMLVVVAGGVIWLAVTRNSTTTWDLAPDADTDDTDPEAVSDPESR